MNPIQRCTNCQYLARLEDGVACMAFHTISDLEAKVLEAENNCPDFKGRILEVEFPIDNWKPWHPIRSKDGSWKFSLIVEVVREQVRQTMETSLEKLRQGIVYGEDYIEEVRSDGDGTLTATINSPPLPAEGIRISSNWSSPDWIAEFH